MKILILICSTIIFCIPFVVDAITPITPTEISHAVDNTWTDVDVPAHLGADASDIAAVILQCINNDGATENNWGVRKNGSTDNVVDILEDVGHTWTAVGIDSSDIFELYLQDASEMNVYLVGYILNSEGGSAVNSTVYNAKSGWDDMDISTATGADTAKVAFFQILVGSNTIYANLRKNGSTDNRVVASFLSGDLRAGMISVDNNEILEEYSSIVNYPKYYLMVWLTDNVTSITNADAFPTGTAGSYQTTDLSGSIPSGNNGAFFDFYPSSNTEYAGAITKNGTSGSYDIYKDITSHQLGWVEIDSDRIIEQKIESTNLDLWIWGYSNTDAGAPPADDPCDYSGTGDWNIDLSENCFKTDYTQVSGALNCFGSGVFAVGDGGTVVAEKMNCPSAFTVGSGKIIIRP